MIYWYYLRVIIYKRGEICVGEKSSYGNCIWRTVGIQPLGILEHSLTFQFYSYTVWFS